MLAKFPSIIDKNKTDKAENLADMLGAVKWNYITARNNNYMGAIEDYFSDHIILREVWMVGVNTLDRLSGKQTINGIYTKNNQMISYGLHDKAMI